MNWAGYTYIILLAMGLGVDLALHGKEKEGRYNFWVSLLAVSIQIVLLYYAGIFG